MIIFTQTRPTLLTEKWMKGEIYQESEDMMNENF